MATFNLIVEAKESYKLFEQPRATINDCASIFLIKIISQIGNTITLNFTPSEGYLFYVAGLYTNGNYTGIGSTHVFQYSGNDEIRIELRNTNSPTPEIVTLTVDGIDLTNDISDSETVLRFTTLNTC